MPPKAAIGADEDVKFLLTIIKQLSGTPNFQQVADELDLPSKGAAAKRYSRLQGKYNITMSNKSDVGSASPAAEEDAPKKAKGKAPVKKGGKKRKLAETDHAEDDVKAEVESDN